MKGLMNSPESVVELAAGLEARAERSGRPWWFRLWPFWLGLLLLAGLGLHLGVQKRRDVDARMRASLLVEAEDMARDLSPSVTREVASTVADVGHPAYQILHEQLRAFSKEASCAGSFTLVQRNGTLLFGPESHGLGSPLAQAPGVEYRQRPAQMLSVFQDGKPVVAGPYTDERGSFVTAFVPVLDAQTGAILMVLGVDVLAADWQARVAQVHWTPDLGFLALALVLLWVAARLGWGMREDKLSSLDLKALVLVPMALTLVAVTLVYAWREVELSEAEQVREMETFASQGEARWDRLFSLQARILEGQLERIASNPALAKAMQERDFARLRQLAQPIFSGLQDGYDINKFYVTDPERMCMLRLHQSSEQRRELEHETLKQAERMGQNAWGLELGSQDGVVLRVVHPWKVQGRLLGYLELGKDIHQPLRQLARDMGVDFVALLRKDLTGREAFEQGKALYQYAGSWDTFPDVVVLRQSLPMLPEALVSRLRSDPKIKRDLDPFSLNASGRQLVGGSIHIRDAAGRFIGPLILLRDVSSQAAGARKRLLMHLSLAGLILLTTLTAFWAVIHQAEGRFAKVLGQAEASEAAFHSLFSDHSAVMLIIDPTSGRILEANHAAESFYGYSSSRFIELNIAYLNVLPPQEVEARRKEALLREVNTFEFQHRLASGELRTVEVDSSPIVWQDRTVLFSIISDITDKKRADDQRQEALDRLEKIASRVPGMVFQFRLRPDGSGAFPYASEGVREMFHLSPEAIRGDASQVFETLHPDDLDSTLTSIRISAVTLQPWRHDARVQLPDGSVRWLHGDAIPEPEADGCVLWHGHFIDVTERMDAEARLRSSEINFRTVFQTVDDIIVVASEDGHIRFTNEACIQKLGYSPSDLNAMGILDLRQASSREAAQGLYQAMMRGETDICTLPLQRKDGQLLPVETRVWHGAWDGEPCLFAISKDLSAQQAALDKFQKMFQGSPALMSVATLPDRRLVEVNDAFLKRLGLTREEVLGRTAEELTVFEDPEVLGRMVEAFQRYGRVVNLPLRVCTRGGEVMDCLFSGEVMEHLGERSLLSVVIDLTAQKQAEAGFRRAIEDMADLNRELAEARDRALNAVEARSRFLANISHEIRTPLNGLLGMAELLGDSDLTPEQLDYVSWISRCGSNLFSFLNDILDFSKMEAGQLTLEAISFDLRRMVYDTAELFRARLATQSVQLLVDYDPTVPFQVMGDAGRFRQILNNLVSNAVKFTAKGHILISVRALPLAGPAFRLVLSVQDTGIGIASDKQAQLFQPFVQADASTARRFGGTGLGLAIVKGLVEAMDGRISLESHEGIGSTFTVEVDLCLDPNAAQTIETDTGLDGMRLLLAADLPTNLDALRRQLQAQGVYLEEAVTSAEALTRIEAAQLRDKPFDLVVIDLIKPEGLDDMALGQAIRADARWQSVALALLTSIGFKGDPARLAALGFDAYLLKPMPSDQLCRSLALAIQHRRQKSQNGLITRYTLLEHKPSEPQEEALCLQGRILVAEDQETNQIVIRKFLERVGVSVTLADNGSQALEAVTEATFDLVLMDCQMPGMDGLEATARIRASEQGTGRHLPIIAMTAHATAQDRERCLAAGMDDYLTKPIHRETLFKVVAGWLQMGTGDGLAVILKEPSGPLPREVDPALELDHDLFGKLLDLYDQEAKALGNELLSPFLSTGQKRLDILQQCLAKDDFEGLINGAHALKGSARTLGFRALGMLMERLEQEAKTTQRQALEVRLQEARRAFAAVEEFFQRLMA
jgi:PAS domain S-box-containing protein